MKKLLFMFVLTISSAQVADAADEFYKYYVGASAGQSEFPNFCDGISGAVDCDDSGTGWKVLWGYQATKNFGIEVSFVDFGEFTVTLPPAEFKAESSGFSVVGVGTLHDSEGFGLFGKIGLVRWDLKLNANGVSLPRYDNNRIDLTYGVGVIVKAAEQILIRIEWEQFSDVGNTTLDKIGDVNLLSAGIVLPF